MVRSWRSQADQDDIRHNVMSAVMQILQTEDTFTSQDVYRQMGYSRRSPPPEKLKFTTSTIAGILKAHDLIIEPCGKRCGRVLYRLKEGCSLAMVIEKDSGVNAG